MVKKMVNIQYVFCVSRESMKKIWNEEREGEKLRNANEGREESIISKMIVCIANIMREENQIKFFLV